ncbi:GPW/gp25 family protein [Moritella sp. 28]|uniref:GPW/gp25 family protein n=1 Tax=Moritella sp. 28 TaxID=2746232 RepID=UPI001BA882F1|nr:GPW/gp25 family protein [Moritella sp. 28]QUM84180.1 GPW/gp25 family protein [Moritella sp. 28]
MSENGTLDQTGWTFPPRFNINNKAAATDQGVAQLSTCMKLMLAIQPGERIGHSNYGCDLSSYAFESLSYELLEGVEDIVSHAVETYESRLVLQHVEAVPATVQEGLLQIKVAYTTSTNEFAQDTVIADLNATKAISL